MEGAYTQQELLLLSNFVYIPACLSDEPIGDIIESYRDPGGGFTPESVYPAAAGGGMSLEDVCCVFTEMDKRIRENPEFGRISISRKLEESNVRALCYTDPKDENPVVAFRGTGGTEDAWTDNFEGAFCSDTDIQRTANDFIEHECGIYRDIVVTGHSKGGNMAQYVTVKQRERVMECVSFDGQGFGDGFREQNKNDIEVASPKIISVSAYNDFVNILLTAIAGTTIYVANEATLADAHSSVSLLRCNEFDENGDFITTRGRGVLSGILERITKVLCSGLDPLTNRGKEDMSLVAGTAISLALTTPKEELENGVVAPTMGLIGAKVAERIGEACRIVIDEVPLESNSIYFDAGAVRSAAGTISEQIHCIDRVKRGVESVRQDMAYTISTQIFADRALLQVCENLEKITNKLSDLAETIEQVALCYTLAENEAASTVEAGFSHI
ncbi:MAG: DUF2974 domain-containing protein [Lachnospiraceae bacterium]|nr:DUF2974 domain-containing protein [Lachnospiraceae bacterium]